MKKLGIAGYRGMVGSVLMQRMKEAGDFSLFDCSFFSSSQKNQKIAIESQDSQKPRDGKRLNEYVVKDAFSLEELSKMDIIISCQGGDYTQEIYPKLRATSWRGHWIDAASTLRMNDDAIIVLDPVNADLIDKALKEGVRTFVGGNCTVSLMLMAIAPLFKSGLIEWATSMTYQAASGAGAKNMKELISQMAFLSEKARPYLHDPHLNILGLDKELLDAAQESSYPKESFGASLALSLIPWIDSELDNGQSREEWKGGAELNKILKTNIPLDGLCVRVSSMRSHAQALTLKLKKDLPLKEIEEMIRSAHEWVEIIPNHKEETLKYLNPLTTSGTLKILVGRLRKLSSLGGEFLTLFTVGDQLLWGAAEPLRRMLRIVHKYQQD